MHRISRVVWVAMLTESKKITFISSQNSLPMKVCIRKNIRSRDHEKKRRSDHEKKYAREITKITKITKKKIRSRSLEDHEKLYAHLKTKLNSKLFGFFSWFFSFRSKVTCHFAFSWNPPTSRPAVCCSSFSSVPWQIQSLSVFARTLTSTWKRRRHVASYTIVTWSRTC